MRDLGIIQLERHFDIGFNFSADATDFDYI